ncbi:MAG: cytochrome c maturation protein CcmE [bacterium]
MSGKTIKVAVSFTIIVLVLGWLVISGFNENMQYYVSIDELKTMSEQEMARGLRVKGTLVSGSLVENVDNLNKTFRIFENDSELEVRYVGLLPDTFKDGAEVLVEGAYTSAGYFDAQTVMAKCPSKYEAAEGYNQTGGKDNGSTAKEQDGTF